MSAELVFKYFPSLSDLQKKQFVHLFPVYSEWNARINVVSRKDIDLLYERHVLHSLGIAKVIQFAPGTSVLDVGTGGGFPGIPLAIMFPEVQFTLVDSIGKKIKVVQAVAESLGLNNVRAFQERAENVSEKYDFIVSRAVTEFPEFYNWVKYKIKKENKNKINNGILYLKGGDLTEELAPFAKQIQQFELKKFFHEEFFESKKVVYLPFN